MRHQPTLAEQRLWRALKAHRLGGLGFRRQVPMGNYIADFVCHGARLVVEVDGETHSSQVEVRRDCLRDEWFASRGYTTLRIMNDDIRRDLDSVVGAIWAACKERAAPLPDPPPQGGRETETGS
jgi:very-short-patch-repair endonuclease